MADIPDGVEWGIVVCNVGRVLSDSADSGRLPDMKGLTGTITLQPSVTPWIQVPLVGRYYAETLVCPVIDGVMYPPGTSDTLGVAPGVPAVATNQPQATPQYFQWVASFQIDGVDVQPASILFNVPSGGLTVDLAGEFGVDPLPTYVPVVSSQDTEKIEQIAQMAVATSATAAAAAETAQAAAEAAGSALVDSEGFVGDQVATSGKPAHAATQELIRASVFTGMQTFGAVGDGVTDDTAAFAAMRTVWPAARIDLGGRSYKVDAVPTGPFTNGAFMVDGITHPTDEVAVRVAPVTSGSVLSHWAQDQAHHYRGVRYAGFGRGVGHGTVDNAAWLAASYDRGDTWSAAEQFPSTGDQSAWCASMGVLSGQQFAVVRYAGYPTDTNIADFKMYARRLFDMWALSAPFTTTAGSNVVTVTFPSTHGLRHGDVLNFSGAGVVNGVTISGNKTVTRVSDTQITVAGSGNATASVSGVGPAVTRVNVVQQPWAEVKFSGVSFGTRLLSQTSMTALPITIQSFAGFGNARAFMTASGNARADVILMTGLFNALPTISSTQISGAPVNFVGGEPTICVDAAQTYAYGFSRVIGDTPTRFYWASDIMNTAGATFTVSTMSRQVGLNKGNPAPVRHDPVHDVLVTVHMNRDNPTGANRGAVIDPVYIGIARAADARAIGGDAFKFVPLATVLKVPSGYSPNSDALGAINSGVPSLDIDGDDVSVFFSQERVNAEPGADGRGTQASNIQCARFSLAELVSALGEAL